MGHPSTSSNHSPPHLTTTPTLRTSTNVCHTQQRISTSHIPSIRTSPISKTAKHPVSTLSTEEIDISRSISMSSERGLLKSVLPIITYLSTLNYSRSRQSYSMAPSNPSVVSTPISSLSTHRAANGKHNCLPNRNCVELSFRLQESMSLTETDRSKHWSG